MVSLTKLMFVTLLCLSFSSFAIADSGDSRAPEARKTILDKTLSGPLRDVRGIVFATRMMKGAVTGTATSATIATTRSIGNLCVVGRINNRPEHLHMPILAGNCTLMF